MKRLLRATNISMNWFALAMVLVFVAMLADRRAPVDFTGWTPPAPVAERGGVLEIIWEVERHRICDVKVTSVLEDANGFRHILAQQQLSKAALMEREDQSKGVSPVRRPIPDFAAVGPAVYAVEFAYTCNPAQALWPITYRAAAPVQIIEPKG